MTSWLAAHRRSVLFLFAVATLAGLFAAVRLPVSLFPRIDFPRIVVSVDAGERPSDQMVVEVTRPLEQALRGVPLSLHAGPVLNDTAVACTWHVPLAHPPTATQAPDTPTRFYGRHNPSGHALASS